MAEVAVMPPSSALGSVTENSASTTASDVVTVFDDPNEFNCKHPLAHKWTLWFTKPPSGKQDWNELLKEVISFDTVEEFWGIYNNITPASELAAKSDYHVFKYGVRPEWEDSQNKNGGRWAYTFKGSKPNDDIWLQVLLAAIGEQLEDDNDNEVMGVVVNVRKSFHRIGLWTRSAGGSGRGQNARSEPESKAVLERIGRCFKDVLFIKDGEQSRSVKDDEMVEFMGHSDSAHAGSSRAKAKFSV